MFKSNEKRQELNKLFSEALSKISTGFMELSSSLRSINVSSEIQSQVDKLFRMMMEFNRNAVSEANILLDSFDKVLNEIERTKEEKRKLEILYSSGILFSSETEMQQLMSKAIDTVVNELKADSGFIILTNNEGEIDSIVAKNFDVEKNVDAKELSTSVVKSTITHSKPVNVQDVKVEDSLYKKTSIIRLGLTAVLCVPLISGNTVFGAVYIDRREKNNPFNENDLSYLLSFAKQIVKGMEISLEITTLEKKLISEATMKFQDLRKEFNCSTIIGTSKKLFDILKVTSKVAPTDASIIILGENGTGKELLARAIHENSRRANQPFVAINCGAIPSELLESELFGYEGGAFTGASKAKPGRIETAHKGTLFLDEIAEMSVNLQSKLLRILQTKEIERLGSVDQRKIDIRIIAATNKNIKEQISSGEFREDLYYRLKVIELVMPPLRERKEDIKLLCEYFLKKYDKNETGFTISDEALAILEEYDWPGNIRELENVIQRGIVLSKNDIIERSDLPPEIEENTSEETQVASGKSLTEAETEFRRMYIIRALRQTNSKAEAAQLLGINRTHFYKLLSQLEIDY